MKVLFQTRSDLFDFPAGDTVQIQNTAACLTNLGVEVAVNSDINMDLSSFDLVHIFNTHHIDFSYSALVNAKKQGKPVVLTPIIINLSEYDFQGRWGMEKWLYRILGGNGTIETLKYFILGLIRPRERSLYKKFSGLDYNEKKKRVLEMADVICSLSLLEKEFILDHFNIRASVYVTPNGVKDFFYFSGENCERDCLLSVGKIEPLKNQLKVIEAYEKLNLDEPLIFIGRHNPLHPGYFRKFLKHVAENPKIKYFPGMEQKELKGFYRRAKVHILASWFENAPLVNLEAGMSGCKIVTTDRGFGRDYLGDTAWYCDPSDANSIAKCICEALEGHYPAGLPERIRDKYTWENTALKVKRIYEVVLSAKFKSQNAKVKI